MSHPQTINFLESQKEAQEEAYDPKNDTAQTYWRVGQALQEEMEKEKNEAYNIIRQNSPEDMAYELYRDSK